MNQQLDALGKLYLSTAPTADEVWTALSPYHVDGLHPEVAGRLVRSMNAVSHDYAPIAAVVLGERGTGKTHLLGWTRQEIQSRGGFFFHIKLVTGQDFWESATAVWSIVCTGRMRVARNNCCALSTSSRVGRASMRQLAPPFPVRTN